MDRLSHSEWQLMRIVWQLGRASVRDVLQEDRKTRKRDYRTILTLLSRMAAKGWLEVGKDGQVNYYTAALPQRKALEKEIRRFLDEVVGPEPGDLKLVEKALKQRTGRRGGP